MIKLDQETVDAARKRLGDATERLDKAEPEDHRITQLHILGMVAMQALTEAVEAITAFKSDPLVSGIHPKLEEVLSNYQAGTERIDAACMLLSQLQPGADKREVIEGLAGADEP